MSSPSAIGVGPVIDDAGLRERDAGEWSGLTRDEIHERYPGYLPDDRHHDVRAGRARTSSGVLRGGRPTTRCSARVLEAIRRVHLVVGDGDGLVVTHGGVIYVLEGFLGRDRSLASPTAAGDGSTSTATHLTLGERVLLVNDDGTPVTVPTEI